VNPTQPPLPDVRTDSKAIWSLVLGVLSVTCLWILAGIPAIVLGHISRSAIRSSMGRLKGEGMALAGLVLGYVSVALLPVVLIVATIAIPSLLRARQAANESAAVANLRTISGAEKTYLSGAGNGSYTDMDALISSNLLDESFKRSLAGYTFEISATGANYVASATPASPSTGRFAYSVSDDGVIRYSTMPSLAPPGQAGLPVR
jgi:type II secretory pathway pseudopilin PulG